MKIFFLSFTLFVISIKASAQQTNVQIPFLPASPKFIGLNPVSDPSNSPANNHKKQLTRSPGGYPPDTNTNWFCYAWDWATINQAGPYFYTMELFPDTDIIESFMDTSGKKIPQYPFFHGAATIVDPYNFQYTPWVNGPYTIDSIQIQGIYIRTTDSSIVDTLVVTVLKSKHVDYATLLHTPPPDDTIWWKVVSYNPQTNSIWDSVQYQVFKYPLTEKDSIPVAYNAPTSFPTNVKSVFIALTNPIPLIDSPNVIGISVEFIPGYSYSLANNDSLGGENSYSLMTTAERRSLVQDVNVFGNYNYSYVLTTNLRYGDPASGFNGQYYPSIGFKNFGGQNHLIYIHLTPYPLGINQLLVSNGLNFYPNPARDEANLEYNLKNNAQKVSLKIFDLTGKQLMDIEKTSQSAGTHLIPLCTETLAKGMYLYSLIIDGQPVNGKFIVQ